MKILKNIIIIAILAIIFFSLFIPVVSAFDINIGNKSDLIKEKELPGLLQFKSNGALKLVVKVFYKSGTNKLPAFCVEPSKDGVGTGAGDKYVGTISKIVNDPKVWRAMYHGYLGKKWNETSVECDDDWYFVNKTVVHCIANGTKPSDVYKVPSRIANSDAQSGLTLNDIKRRGQKILTECDKLYEYAQNGTENYMQAKIELQKSGNLYESGNYMVQNYSLIGNKEIGSYTVAIDRFPNGTTYEKSDGNVLKIKIPKASINQDHTGIVYITKAEVKTYPAFYCEAPTDNYQDYIVVADPYEFASTRTLQEVDSHKSTLIVVKSDKEDNQKIPGVVFNVKYEDGENVGNFTTDVNGKITINKLRPGKLILTEVSTNANYILDRAPYEITISYNSIHNLDATNEHKKGNLKVFKVDKDNNKITLGNVEFDLYSDEYKKVIGTYVTDQNGEFTVKNLRTGNYKLIEKKTNKWYNLAENTEIKIKWDNVTETIIENELKKSQIKVIKADSENNKIYLSGVKLNVLDENKNVLETIVTNDEGIAMTKKYAVRDYSILYVQEIETDEMYVLDDTLHEIELKENSTVTLNIENEKIKGQIEIFKVDKNDHNKKLKDFEFGIYDKNDKLIEVIKTNEDGRAISSLIEKGTYTVKELITGSIYYLLNPEVFEVEIKNHKEVITLIIENEHVDIKVDVDKKGTVETKPNEQVQYIFNNIANESNIYLDSFKWYEYLPTDYIKIETLQTGTWNQKLIYDIYVKTNKSDNYIPFKEKLDTQTNYEINMKLENEDEYITEFYFDFGKVDIGFKEEISPTINCKTLENLKNGDKFTNRTQTIGIYGDLIADANSKWITIVHIPEQPKEPVLPRTGR